MKKINKNFVDRPKNLCTGWRAYDKAILKLSNERMWPSKPSGIYSSTIVKEKLDSIYHTKCAFCNQEPKGSPLQVEHFRPKDGIKNEAHPGYYWLGYEWTNLLYACGNCNTIKSNYFPLLDGVRRITAPLFVADLIDLASCHSFSSFIKSEKYVLVNPEVDNPDQHFVYLPDGKIYHLTERGEYSITRYDLNRDELYVNGRKRLLDGIIEKFAKKLDRYQRDERNFKSVSEDIVDIIKGEILVPIERNCSFDHFLYKIYSNHREYILPRFGIRKQIVLLDYTFERLKYGITIKLS
ncbi:hypothetical protein [Sunxiuqinia elliptica]|uniref:Uncharacterized protein (TIGR02646 family) n=1 Tax=Sunxiuqinia elliptica TaxID=655355 RepID=A0A4R6HBN4_9BACT|nr:hypothetical protein [Sunxiuqinia elliptica]TDO05427.1 uncharacterized protein (TIGR02646 family) [Sunxiuqinia elliptica]TDO64973.1 uncharacterized protein (TIGR02646 family) [Sunxiuqinia elliptica]